MNFRAYRKEQGWTLAEAADFLGDVDGSTVAKHEIGSCLPNVELIGRYEKLTGGKVKAQDFVAACQQFKANPDRARKRVGARRLRREKAAA